MTSLNEYLQYLTESKVNIKKGSINDLLTSPKRISLYKKGKTIIDRLFKTNWVKKIYVIGSFTTNKKNPSDIDLMMIVDPKKIKVVNRPKENSKEVESREWDEYIDQLYINPTSWSFMIKEYYESGIKKYGQDYFWVKIKG